MERAQMTEAQWKRLGEALRFSHSSATLEVDGFNLNLQVDHVGPLKLAIVFYVNGRMRGEWILNDCEERRRFFRPVEIRLFSFTKKAKLIKSLGKKRAYEMFDLDRARTYFISTWLSFVPLKRHLIKNNASIRLISINGTLEPQA